jgi:secreted trypsin-like serine protease
MPARLPRTLLTCLTLALGALLPAGHGLAQGDPSFTCTLPDDTRGTSRSATARVVGGTDADWRDWPWQVFVRAGTGVCGGSIINPQWVLTAAHCAMGQDGRGQFYDRPAAEITVWHGGSVRMQGGTTMRVSGRFIHPDYARIVRAEHDAGRRPPNGVHDIMLLRLAQPIPNLPRGAIVNLQGVAAERLFSPGGSCAVVTGWGVTGAGDLSARLQQVDVPIVDFETCRRAYPGLNANNLCAGYQRGTRDSCGGDSGGPLVVQDPLVPPPNPDTRLRQDRPGFGWSQVGIVSYGRGCAEPDSYGVYMRVAPYAEWIVSTVTAN